MFNLQHKELDLGYESPPEKFMLLSSKILNNRVVNIYMFGMINVMVQYPTNKCDDKNDYVHFQFVRHMLDNKSFSVRYIKGSLKWTIKMKLNASQSRNFNSPDSITTSTNNIPQVLRDIRDNSELLKTEDPNIAIIAHYICKYESEFIRFIKEHIKCLIECKKISRRYQTKKELAKAI